MAQFKIPIVIDGLEIIEKMKAEGKLVAVTRCAECVHSYEDIGGRICSYGVCVDCVVPDDFFCKDGEPKEANDEQNG